MPKENRYRSRAQKEHTPSSNRQRPSVNWNWLSFLQSPKTVLALGVFLMLLAVLLEISFLSYVVNGNDDQGSIDDASNNRFADSRMSENTFGFLGALVSHIFIFRWFGLGALLLPLIPFLTGWKLFYKTELLPLRRTTQEVLFFTIWISLLLGYVVLMSNSEQSLSFLCGGFGYEANQILFALLRWGSIIPIIFVLFLFAIFFYGVTRLPFFQRPEEELDDEPDDDAADEPEPERVSKKPRPSFSDSYDEEDTTANSIPVTQADDVPSADEPVEIKLEVEQKPTAPQFEIATPVHNEPALTLEIDETEHVSLLTPAHLGTTDQDELSDQLVREFGQYDPTLDLPQYKFPNLDLFNEVNPDQQEKVSSDELESNKNRIVDTLASYGISIDKIKATIGPTVTLYEIIPAPGVRISKIQNLEKDIALSLSALGIRIIAPMPGRGTIGIEVPNKQRETVYMRSVLASERFQKANYELPVILGKTISNEIYVADLTKMPHLLMAGATGQGKSVGLNVLLASLIYKKHPAQLKFVLVDPKKVELTLFNKLERHFLAKLPNTEEAIITDTKKVIYTLNSLCIEMDTRYDLLKEATARNIKEYNAKFVQRKLNPERGHRYLPYIVLVIDELADLMMTAGKEVETPIARLAQLARAVGIHLVVATQRPSVKIITGLIKANFPARLSFKVTSGIDSRTILDAGGAEQLVGAGDMLLSVNSDVIRLQCPFIETHEIEEVCEYIGYQRGYDEAYALPEFEGDEGGDGKADFNTEDFDPMLSEAARLLVTHQQGSTSLIQRKMKLGYNRAGRIIDQLEMIGVVGPFTGSKAREVLYTDLESLERNLSALNLS